MNVPVNPWVSDLHAYVPGEQPREPGFVKLNTNESPYSPAPEVLQAVLETAQGASYNKYPDPLSSALREAFAADLGFETSNVFVGNGSDEVLRLLCHAFLSAARGDQIGMLNPTYVLYDTLATMFGCESQIFDLQPPDYSFPDSALVSRVRIFFLPSPNPPLGTHYPSETIRALASADPARLVVIDEAYIDFAHGSAIELVKEYENLVITRTFSKSYSLAGLRVGFAVANEEIIRQLDKIRDSYNLNRVSQAAALAAWRARAYHGEMCERIRQDRDYLTRELRQRGFEVPDSQGNFVFARKSGAAAFYQALKERKVLVRYFNTPALQDGVRITIGTREELEILLREIDSLCGE
jgi:histidinol-phosphate aminotransferase